MCLWPYKPSEEANEDIHLMKIVVEGSSLQSKQRKAKDEFYLPHHSHIHSSKNQSLSIVFEWMSRQLIQTLYLPWVDWRKLS